MRARRVIRAFHKPTKASGHKRFAPLPDPKRKVVNILIESHEKRVEWNSKMVAMSADIIGIRRSGPIPLPSKCQKWNLGSSPFKHKKATEFLRRVTHRRLICIEGPPEVCDRFVRFAVEVSDPTCGIRIREKQYHTLESFLNYKGA
eukprot:TRINITY_DN903_c1_g2_i1.p1 TRINITY_DN903_c1_g2~~TRINITY_DN903_c1_g2_i1.p1  ORF type:complete len:146 (+),score=11.82 TRINITY_DN903_c1_g2_i1:8-445(+)